MSTLGYFHVVRYPTNYGIFVQKTILTYYYLNATWLQIFGEENVNRAGYSSVPRVRTSMQEPLKRGARCSPLVARAFSTQASHLCRGRSSEAPFLFSQQVKYFPAFILSREEMSGEQSRERVKCYKCMQYKSPRRCSSFWNRGCLNIILWQGNVKLSSSMSHSQPD